MSLRTPLIPFLLAFATIAASAAGLPERRTASVFGQHIAYFEAGSGPTVVLLHGLGSSADRDWGACIEALAAHHHVLAPDQLGFGASDKPLIEFGIQTWVDMLGEFLRVKQVKDFTLAGESLGGWIAALYTLQSLGPAPTAGPAFALPPPRRLILVDAAGHRKLAEWIVSGTGGATSLAGAKALLGAIYFDPKRASESAVRAQFEQNLGKGDGWTIHALASNKDIVGESLDDRLGAVSVPTLVVWGAQDTLIPLADGRDYAAKIPGARLVIIPDSGHAPAIEQPDAFLAAALAFIDAP